MFHLPTNLLLLVCRNFLLGLLYLLTCKRADPLSRKIWEVVMGGLCVTVAIFHCVHYMGAYRYGLEKTSWIT